MEVLSPSDIVIFEGWIKRDSFEFNETPDDANRIELLNVSKIKIMTP